jgi:FtsP/CotA-like multicopper oxidase with cupredoxin domain
VKTINVTENPTRGDTEDWEMYNFTADAHPIHLHLVRFEVLGRRAIPGFVPVAPVVQPWESGFKDTVISYPGEITTIRAKFEIEGLYVWHCHIVEHEDNEMMRPYVVSAP